ncbi:hypothetical protein Dimus_004289 [Dionaea muscipula]
MLTGCPLVGKGIQQGNFLSRQHMLFLWGPSARVPWWKLAWSSDVSPRWSELESYRCWVCVLLLRIGRFGGSALPARPGRDDALGLHLSMRSIFILDLYNFVPSRTEFVLLSTVVVFKSSVLPRLKNVGLMLPGSNALCFCGDWESHGREGFDLAGHSLAWAASLPVWFSGRCLVLIVIVAGCPLDLVGRGG